MINKSNHSILDISKLTLEEFNTLHGMEAKLHYLANRLTFSHYPDSLKEELKTEKAQLAQQRQEYLEQLFDKYGE